MSEQHSRRRNEAAESLRRYMQDDGWEHGVSLLDEALAFERAPDGECPPCIDTGVAHVVGMPPHVTAEEESAPSSEKAPSA